MRPRLGKEVFKSRVRIPLGSLTGYRWENGTASSILSGERDNCKINNMMKSHEKIEFGNCLS